jgi:2-polyprenyl-6-methoxyphenol hydroxylase-like FAD-dependent oxidoreductase
LLSCLLAATDITSALKTALPEGTLHPSCPITSYRLLPDNTIQLIGPRPLGSTTPGSSDASSSTDGSSSEEHVVATCNLLVGADGWFSPIRQQLLGDGPPVFKDCVVWRARIQRPEDFPEDRTRWWIPPTGARAGDVLAVLIPLPGGDLVWQCHAPVRVLAEKGLSFDPVSGEAGSSHASNNTASTTSSSSSSSSSEQTPKERCLQTFSGFPAAFLDMVEATPAAAITEHGLYQRTPEQIPDGTWGAGPITLAGDAAHAAYVDGTGLALSLEDAAVLGWYVQQLGLTPEALRAYEAERIPRVKAIFELAARQAARPRGSQTPEAWAERAELLYGGASFQPLVQASGQQAAAVQPKAPVAASV